MGFNCSLYVESMYCMHFIRCEGFRSELPHATDRVDRIFYQWSESFTCDSDGTGLLLRITFRR